MAPGPEAAPVLGSAARGAVAGGSCLPARRCLRLSEGGRKAPSVTDTAALGVLKLWTFPYFNGSNGSRFVTPSVRSVLLLRHAEATLLRKPGQQNSL